MSHESIIRAWKDEAFRNSLSADMRALLPDNPAGFVQLSDAELGSVAAGGGTSDQLTYGRKITGCGCPLF
jgi:mersacidin/lichenicidin family type 2 lantibiotic